MDLRLFYFMRKILILGLTFILKDDITVLVQIVQYGDLKYD